MTIAAESREQADSRTEEELYEDYFNEFAGKPADDGDAANVADVETKPNSSVSEVAAVADQIQEEDINAKVERLEREKQELEHQFRSSNGRVSALQQKINLLSKQAPEVKKELTQEEIEEEQQLAATLELYPEFKPILDKIERERKSDIQQISSRIDPITQSEEERYVSSQIEILDKDIPTWKDTVNNESWDKWLLNQPPQIQQMAESLNAADYKYLFKIYSQDNPVDTAEAEKEAKAQQLMQSRATKNAAHVSVKGKGETKQSMPADDYDSAFDYYAAKKQQEALMQRR